MHTLIWLLGCALILLILVVDMERLFRCVLRSPETEAEDRFGRRCPLAPEGVVTVRFP